MADLSIFDFLTHPHKPFVRHLTDHVNGGNTTSRSQEWDYTDIRRVESWDLFSLETLRIRFGPLLDLRISRAFLLEVVADNYLDIHSELQLEILLHMTRFTRVNIALKSLNVLLNQSLHLLDAFEKVLERQVISPGLQYGAGKPDLTFHLYNDQSQLCPIAVGDVKLYAKWSFDRWKSLSLEDRMDFRQVLAQVNYYMRKRRCRYAIAITEVECIAIYRVPSRKGWLKLSDPFPVEWTDNIGRDGSEVMTANVALFGLSLWAQCAADAHEEGEEESEEEEYAELDSYFPQLPSSSPMPSSPPDFRHPASEYLPSSQ
ncbi:hypothetical protein V502_07925 [Pseudogymnoascus sp. VKM F-4520 (FW-2644)]|nr:hypothetical protein V502_07925 [Pseudogymnoascus sp. VKM F-4520 (FW-2644)]